MQELGRLLVARSVFGSSNSNLSLPAEPCVVRFADSRTQNWETNAFLLIRNWDGSPDGDGEHQVLFGDGSGITAQQLAQIRFVNVVGQLPGTFPAKQTATGEIVPVIGPEAPPVLRITSRTSGHIYLQWPVGYTLESATNAAGPFADVWGVYQNPPNRSGLSGGVVSSRRSNPGVSFKEINQFGSAIADWRFRPGFAQAVTGGKAARYLTRGCR
jgi:hypothetical protein